MVHLNLDLHSNESTFGYSFAREFLDKNYEIGLVKLNGILESNKSIISYTVIIYYTIIKAEMSVTKIFHNKYLEPSLFPNQF